MQCNYSTAYSDFNSQLNVSALLMEISGQFNSCCTTNFAPNAAHIPQFTLCELWSRKDTIYPQLLIFWQQYSSERICAAIGHNGTFRCALHCKFGVKYSEYRPVYAVWTALPAIYKVFTAPHSQATIFNRTYLRCNWRYSDTSMLVVLHTWCQIQCTSSCLRHAICGPGHIQCNCSSAYSGFNNQLRASALLSEISPQCNARYTANLEPNIAHIIRFTLCGLWSRTYTM
jgi:hypothetical protein